MVDKKKYFKQRRLWLKVRWTVPPGTGPAVIKETLLRSIRRRDYSLPLGWSVTLYWKNKEEAKWRFGEWADELQLSSVSSSGFDKAVTSWLERQQVPQAPAKPKAKRKRKKARKAKRTRKTKRTRKSKRRGRKAARRKKRR